MKKKGAKTAKTSRKRPRKGKTDALRAVILAGILIALSACISTAVITAHSSVNNIIRSGAVEYGYEEPVPVSAAEEPVQEESAPAPVIQQTPVTITDKTSPLPENTVPELPVITVSVQPASQTPDRTVPSGPADPVPAALRTTLPQQPAEKTGTLVFVIDDAGNNLGELEPFLRYPGPLTIAVLPGLPHSAQAARLIRAAGKEVFLHQPMEALGGQAPGPGAIYSGMSANEIRAVLSRNLAEIGPVAGMNNHQGSKITMDRETMETILGFCAEHGLHFLDSRTTAETVIPAVARRIGMKIGERDVFIDNEQNKASMVRYIGDGLTRARQNGSAVMIGHTWSPELAPALSELYPELTKQGYLFTRASALISDR